MLLSELKKHNPEDYRKAKAYTIIEDGEDYWDECVRLNAPVICCFYFSSSPEGVSYWKKYAQPQNNEQ